MARKKKESIFKVTQFQPDNCVTSSSIMVEVGGKKILMDLGQIQDSSMRFNQIYHSNIQKIQSIPFNELDYVVVTHFHFDHCGMLPVLVREDLGFRGDIITTELTAALSNLIMLDAQRINESEVTLNNDTKKDGKKKYYTYYSKDHVVDTVENIRCYSYNQRIKLSDNLYVTLLPACHASGASMIYLEYVDEYKTHTLLYSGDITYGNKIARPFTKHVDIKGLKVDVLILESTYGRRDKIVYENDNPIDFLEKIVEEEVVGRNQTLWIPSFAVHRATTLYLYLYEVFERNENIKKANIPVYFCGQMMFDAHRIIGKKCFEEYYDEEWLDKKDIFYKEPFGFLVQKKDVEHFCLNNGRKIVISSSGMYDKGYSSLLADSYVANKKVSTAQCGYQGEGTLGWHIREGSETANVNGRLKHVRLKNCGTIPSLSGHASHDGLIKFVRDLNQGRLKEIILVHGDTDAKQELKEDLEKALPKNKKIHIINQFERIDAM